MESVKRMPVANEVGSKKTKLPTDLIYIGINRGPKREKWSRDPRAEVPSGHGHGKLCTDTERCNG